MKIHSHGLFEGQQGRKPDLQMRKIDLQLPAEQYIYHLQETTELGNFHGLGHFQKAVDLELSLCLQSEVKAKETSERNQLGKKTLQTVINLEEPPKWLSNKETEPAVSVSFATQVSCLRRNLESEVSTFSVQTISETVKKDLSVKDGKCYDKEGFFYQGMNGCNNDKASDNMSTSKQQFVSSASGLLDLNKVPIDDPVLAVKDCVLHDLNLPYAGNTQLTGEKSEIEDPTPLSSSQSQNNIQEKDGTRSPASYTSCCITDNDSRTQSRVSSPHSSDQISHTQVESRVTETLSSEAEQKCCDKGEEDSYEMDPLVQTAAESLFHISFNNSAPSQDFSPQPGLGNNAETECSFDSYELLTLNLTESSCDDYCESSKPLDEVKISEKDKDFGFKLRRGRRMKNFQKEILPSLVCLSRHEIQEDINIFEAVLRSREYKKITGKMGERSLCTPLKNKGSRPSYVGRKRKSK